MILSVIDNIKDLPTGGWAVVALIGAGLLTIIGQLIRNQSTSNQINRAVNNRPKEDPSLVNMVAETNKDIREMRMDTKSIMEDVAELKEWKASFEDSELRTGVAVANFVHYVRDEMQACREAIAKNSKLIERHGCPKSYGNTGSCLDKDT